ncbi:hypothetical protein J437_LFUL005036 [Ladona fulva]|uniref:Heme oxygenase n=1 Tax=Ladona fulva TaxID=123851 RepID=A0A8K0NSA0_LADFU|nr:hypothetical protein J437_LFUL005036 [Ladona fulva]
MEEEQIPFTKQMRKATREIHDLSDALVNAKLAFALSDFDVWAEGLLIFYEIFRFLEEAMERHKDSALGELMVDGMKRTEAFEKDLSFYLGDDWASSYTPRESVVKYLLYLRELEKKDPDLLMAFVYHLYMGLWSGGQILRKKRMVVRTVFPFVKETLGGNDVTDFGNNSVSKFKRTMSTTMNKIADTLSPEKKAKLIHESKMVFVLNNEIIRTVRGTTQILVKKVLIFSLFIAVLCIIIAYIFK